MAFQHSGAAMRTLSTTEITAVAGASKFTDWLAKFTKTLAKLSVATKADGSTNISIDVLVATIINQ
jgi:hypothetical protein